VASRLSQVGEAFAGSGPEAAHLNTVLGEKGGPVETAWATALVTPREGHCAFVVVAQPNIPVRPMTLFVNKATIASPEYARLTWGPAQMGVASGVLDAVANEVISEAVLLTHLLIAAVWVDPEAHDADAIYEFNRAATFASLARGASDDFDLAELLAVREQPVNGYYVPKPLRRDEESID
jgi:5,6,7,8-tetrahydromethanopterin hydro-lyase